VNILGLNAYHGDSAAAIVVNGKLVAAAEEERFRRIKHWAGFPSEAIRYCLAESGLGLKDLDVVALNQDSSANLWRKIRYTIAHHPDPKLIWDRIRNKRKRESVGARLAESFPGQSFPGRIIWVEHHRAHLFSTFYVSPFEEAVALSVDGFGDFASAAWGVGRDHEVTVDGRVYFPHSLGVFYQALTQYLGFPHYGDEYKVMGLAPYGKPAYLKEMREVVNVRPDGSYELNLSFFRHHKEKIAYEWLDGAPAFGCLFSDALIDLLGPPRGDGEPVENRHHDIASSVQAMYEDAFFQLLASLSRKYDVRSLALAGGCAMNSVANGKVARSTPFDRIYIQSAAGDAGGAVGAAFAVQSELDNSTPRFRMDHAYWGPEFGADEVTDWLTSRRSRLETDGCVIEQVSGEDALCLRTAQAVSEGKVVGWFQGRMEWGPRALGNRSIICDPRRTDMKDILNAKIKRRESFRPFAPSILREAVPDWFEQDDDVPFMMKVFQIKEEQRKRIPAVTHVDGSGRLQTVSKTTNPLYYTLIEAFNSITGIPLVLNTSFNENEPVVCRPEQALDCFMRTEMDMLVIRDWTISRK
jgi:carbamoyltransferase